MRVALAAGHTPRAWGATAVDGAREHVWQVVLVHQVLNELRARGHEAEVFRRPEGPYLTAMASLVEQVNAWRPDLALELHFDACPLADEAQREKWSGPTGLHWPGSARGEAHARALASAVGVATGRRARVRSQTTSSSGKPLLWLRDIARPSVLLETHFGSHRQDHAEATRARDDGRLAAAIAGAVG